MDSANPRTDTRRKTPIRKIEGPAEASGNIRKVPIDLIRLDSAYQRDLDTNRVNRLVRDWNPQLAGILILSLRAGILWAVDGQHRLAAMRERGDTTVDVMILEGLQQTQEAELFVKYNNLRKTLNAWELFKAEIAAQDRSALEVVRIVNATGYTLTQMPGPRNIQALQCVRRIHRLGGEDLLRLTLQTVRSVWTEDRHALTAQVLGGLSLFFFGFAGDPVFKPDRLQNLLERTAPTAFLRVAQQVQYDRMTNGVSTFAVAEAIRQEYNKGLSPRNRLGPVKTTNGRGLPLSRPR